MLRYGNTVRHIPNFRRAAGARLAVDANHTSPLPHGETVVAHPDLKLSEALTQTTQWFAEALAAGHGDRHTCTSAWRGNGEFVVDMREPWDRAAYFNAPRSVSEVAGGAGESGVSPHYWMASGTHYRWWFGVNGTYPVVGLGTAHN